MRSLPFLLVVCLWAPGIARADAVQLPVEDSVARDLYKELVEIDTSDATGSTTKAAEAMAKRLLAAGFAKNDVQVLGPNPKKHNLVARLHGNGKKKPLLLLAHIDVVAAHKEDWSTDPYKFLEKDGFFYGRGTTDDKAMAAMWVALLIRWKKAGWTPDRDLIVALTADEEGGDFNGVDWLLQNHRELIDAELALNEGGGGEIKNGKYLLNEVQASEKVYQSYVLEVKNRGGHSSLPIKDNAIYRLAEGLARLAKFEFPVAMSEISRGYFERMAAFESGPVARDMRAVAGKKPDLKAARRLADRQPYFNALMRTTCVATRLEGGHADNALPQTARATVNCRLLPGHTPNDVQAALQKVLADPQITITPKGDAKTSQPSPLTPELMRAVEQTTAAMWPGVPVVPTMSTGATDGLYLRNAGIACYGVNGIFEDIDDVRAHGQDERLPVRSFFEGLEFLDRLVHTLSS